MTIVANHTPARRSNHNGGPITAVHPEFTDLLIMTDPTIFPQTVARFYAPLNLGSELEYPVDTGTDAGLKIAVI